MTFGGTELIIVAVIALIFFGPTQLPKLAKSLGKTMREFRGAMDGADPTKAVESAPQPKTKPVVAEEDDEEIE